MCRRVTFVTVPKPPELDAVNVVARLPPLRTDVGVLDQNVLPVVTDAREADHKTIRPVGPGVGIDEHPAQCEPGEGGDQRLLT